ncbi:hypothetical protein ABB37_02490 [Leptomonas pyrrhocoris]|uniref:Uncharacterized protein n=1 Tax=Leptomonas pyrrhocoris TaxID=157538 RepID=A0A0N0DX70_LEPPY|nr:hypothetical protein ABB37_02490 [Leptomonas pyrrhocoris]KPA82655.1 hypothetical protein ABB37_02490 [Leptomonas pyrrhocoris]|eukprot:XP_015661094.1 hypothetical protein ABB37_02490 [Leptomonas pyrrhocoris]
MPLSSSCHDFGDALHAGGRQRSAPSSAAVAGAPTRSPVQQVGRSSTRLRYGHSLAAPRQRPASPDGTHCVTTVPLGTATLAKQGERHPSRSLPMSLPQPQPERRAVSTSPRHEQQEHLQGLASSTDGRSSAALNRYPRRSAQSLPSHVNPTFQTEAGSNARLSQLRSTTPSASLSRDTAALHSIPPNSTSSAAAPPPSVPSTSPRLGHLRPLSTSREADYVNLAYQRGLMGRFRCAIPVVVCTPAAATPHDNAVKQEKLPNTTDAAGGQNDEGHVGASLIATHAHVEDANNTGAGTIGAADTTAPTPADLPERRTHREASPSVAADAAVPGNSMLSRPRLSTSRSATSVVSGSTARRGRASGQFPSSASSLPRRSVRSTPMSTGVRTNSTGGLVATASFGGGGGGSGVPAANMEPLTRSGLHTSLWAAVQDGGIEVRSMANPNLVLASHPRKNPRAIITSLVEMCGNRVAAGHTDGSLHLFDAVTLKEVGEHQPHTAAVTKLLYVEAAPRMSLLPDATRRATGGDTKSGPAPMCSLLVTASLDHTITVWEAAAMTLMHRLSGSVRSVCALAATATGGYVFSGSDEGTIRMWDAVRGQQWEATKDERAQLRRGSREGVLVEGGAVTNRSSQRFVEYTEASISANDADHDSSSESLSEDHHAGPRGPFRPHALASLRASGGSASSHPIAPSRGPSNRRSLLNYGGVKVVPHVTCPLNRGILTLQRPSALTRPRDTAGLPCTSSRSLPTTEDVFAPMDAATSPSPFREGDGVLAGPGGDISPLRTTLDYEAEVAEVAGGHGGGGAAVAVRVSPLDDDSRVPASSRKHRIAKKKTRKAGRGQVGTTTSTSSFTGGGGEEKGKDKTPETGKRKKIKKPKKRSAATASQTTAAAAARLPANMLEQRLETWIRLYNERVLFSAASQQLTTRFAAGYDAETAMNWPVECAHAEYIAALAVVEDRLLVSASCDATAKVFALPSGQYMRTLTSSRRMPLSGVLYDSSVGRIYTGSSDGTVSVYDMTSPELPLLSQLQSPQVTLSCTFVPLSMAPMQRFVINGAVEEADAQATEAVTPPSSTAVVTTVAQFDKTTPAHGPNQTTSSYRVGQPSLRELNAAVSLQLLQQQRVANLTAAVRRKVKGTVEAMELRGERQCGIVLAQTHRRRQMSHAWWRWQRWAQRRAVLQKFSQLAETRAHSVAHTLLGQYMLRWVNATRQHKKAAASAVLRAVQLKGSDAALLSVPAEVRSGLRCTLDLMSTTMIKSLNRWTLRCVYRRWREFQRIRHAELQQSVGYNKLLLSMNASADAPSCYTLTRLTRTATQRAHHAQALWLLTELTERWQSQRQRRHFFVRWRACARLRQSMQVRREEDAGWRLVEPLSSTLVQPRLLRRRYFDAWRNFALYLARGGSLASERDTLQREWATLQRALEAPTTVAELTTEVQETEASVAQMANERATLAERVQTLADEDCTLRTEVALRVLIAGYYVSDAVATMATTATTTPRAHAGVTRTALNARRPSMASSVESGTAGGGACRAAVKSLASGAASTGNTEDGLARSTEEQRDKKLLLEASAVLRALKGNCLQCARDDKLLAQAHALSLRLPIYEPLVNDLMTSAETTPSRRSGQQQRRPPPPSQRSTTAWSVSNAKKAASTATSAHTSAASASVFLSAQQQQRRQHSTLSGSVSSGECIAGATGASTPRAAAVNSNNTIRASTAAQMWSAQPVEENYPSLADAFNAIYSNLLALLYSAARECGVAASATADVESGNRCTPAATDGAAVPLFSEGRRAKSIEMEDDDEGTLEELQAPVVAPSWLAQVPLKQRRTMVGEVLKLVTLFDSFAAHSDLPVERAGSISSRGTANTRALPLCSLCSHKAAQSLLRHAAVLLELVDPRLWQRQLKLNYLQAAYAAAIAELNATVSSSHVSEAGRYSSTVITRSESEDRAASVPLPPPALRLSAEVLQRAIDKLRPTSHTPARAVPSSQQTDTHTSPTTTNSGSDALSMRPSAAPAFSTAGRTSSPPYPTALLANLETLLESRHNSCGEHLHGATKSTEEEGQTSTTEPQRAQSISFSHRTFSGVSTPRSYTPRTTTSSVAGASMGLLKPYLGFRVNVTRDAHTARRTATAITIRDVAEQYVNADGVEVDSPALVAGLQVGDQLIRFAGYAVTDLAAFNAVVSRHVHSGAELPVVVQRGEELLSTTIVVGTRIA